MEQAKRKVSKLRRPFVIGGAIVGAGLCGWYLFDNFGIRTVVPDAVWLKFVKVSLLMFCSIYIANLLRNIVEFFIGKN